MDFYIELSNNDVAFRLQQDQSWREIQDRKIKKKDLLISKITHILRLQQIDGSIEIRGQKWSLNPTSFNLGERNNLFYHVYSNRYFIPRLPSKKQLISVIEQGDDRVFNSLILNIYGFFELRDFHTLSIGFVDPSIVFRFETFSSGNKYVGSTAAMEESFIDQLYATCLESWLINLETGKTGMYSDYFTKKSIEEVIQKIEEQK